MSSAVRIAVAVACSLVASSALAAPSCRQSTTAGAWAFRCEGQLPVPAYTPALSLGTCIASRDAFWKCSGSVNLGGTIIPQTLQGQAINNPDCTGTIHYDQSLGGQPAGTIDINYVILDDADVIWGLPTSGGALLACTLRRISEDRSGRDKN